MKKNYTYNDPVHGTIEINGILVKIIDTPEFQRLRSIRQLATAHYLFPGANHTRFEHCIGVSYLAGLVVDKLAAQETSITPADKLCVQIAGLIHDLGHGPFSHLFEHIVNDKTWSHELMSVKIFKQIVEQDAVLRELLSDEGITDTDLVFIEELVNAKNYFKNKQWMFKGRSKEKSFLYEIVANERTGIDVDKFDYLLRDCYYLGVNCTLDWRRLVHMMKVVEFLGEKRIGIRDKEIDNVYNLFQLRMHLHRVAYQHRTTMAVKFMIRDILKTANSLIFNDMLLTDAIYHTDRYVSLTDNVIERIGCMSPSDVSNPDTLKKCHDLIRRIQTRQLYTLVGETPPSDTSSYGSFDDIIRDIIDGEEILEEKLILQELCLNFGKWGPSGDPIQAVVFYDKSDTVISHQLYDKTCSFVPKSWCQKQLRLFCRSSNEDDVSLARRNWCKWLAANTTNS